MVVALQFYSAMGRLLNLEESSYIHRWRYVMRNAKPQCSCLFGKNIWQNRASIFCWNPSPNHHHEIAQFVPCITWCHLYDLSLKPFQVSSFMLKNLATSLTMKHKSEVDVYMCAKIWDRKTDRYILCLQTMQEYHVPMSFLSWPHTIQSVWNRITGTIFYITLFINIEHLEGFLWVTFGLPRPIN